MTNIVDSEEAAHHNPHSPKFPFKNPKLSQESSIKTDQTSRKC